MKEMQGVQSYALLGELYGGMGTNDGGTFVIPYSTKETAEAALKTIRELNEIWHDVIEDVERTKLADTYKHLKTQIDQYYLIDLVRAMFDESLEMGFNIKLVTIELGKISIVK
jgi:hypothetical protein